jgi:hypothetical protein
MDAKDCKCDICGEQAVAFFPVSDPDIPRYPYCRKCLDKIKIELLIKLSETNKLWNEIEKS